MATQATPVAGPVPRSPRASSSSASSTRSGFKEPPCLARRGDGQTIQLTDLLYRVLEAIDGRRDLDALADAVSERIGKQASADDVRVPRRGEAAARSAC